jgi:hypothetical protein
MEDTQAPCSHVVRDFREARSHQGDRPHLSPAFPAAEPVARVAFQHCPIPSDSGMISIDQAGWRLNQEPANGDNPHPGYAPSGENTTGGSQPIKFPPADDPG